MASTDSCQRQRDNCLTLLLANTRSAKGKSSELTVLSEGYDIICLTETHLDDSISSQSIIEISNLDFFRRDRNIYGGGVLIAVNKRLNASRLDLDTLDEEFVAVKIAPKVIVCCYYRPHISLRNIDDLSEIINNICTSFPNHLIILVGDMNLPGIDWNALEVKANTQYKDLHRQFLNTLGANNLNQVITKPTHVYGNTLDLVCTNKASAITSTDVIEPGLSDHFIVTAKINANLKRCTPTLPKAVNIRIFRDADIEAFREHMDPVRVSLSTMDDVQKMWELFSSSLRTAVENVVPVKTFTHKQSNLPKWYNNQAKKLTTKQRKTYNKYKRTGDPFLFQRYRQERRECKKTFKKLKKDFLLHKICKPLARGNSRPLST